MSVNCSCWSALAGDRSRGVFRRLVMGGAQGVGGRSSAWLPDLLSSWLPQVCGCSGQEAAAVRWSGERRPPGAWHHQRGLAHLAGHAGPPAVAALLDAPLTHLPPDHHFWTETCWTWRGWYLFLTPGTKNKSEKFIFATTTTTTLTVRTETCTPELTHLMSPVVRQVWNVKNKVHRRKSWFI